MHSQSISTAPRTCFLAPLALHSTSLRLPSSMIFARQNSHSNRSFTTTTIQRSFSSAWSPSFRSPSVFFTSVTSPVRALQNHLQQAWSASLQPTTTFSALPFISPGTDPIFNNPDLLSLHQFLLADTETPFGTLPEIANNSLLITGVVFFLTFWGMISFLKGSTKDRITQASFEMKNVPPSQILSKTVSHFASRAYKLLEPGKDDGADMRKGVLTFEGLVSPSTFVAFLVVSAGVSMFMGLTLVLNVWFEQTAAPGQPPLIPSQAWTTIYVLSALAGSLTGPWYWKGASRVEQVKAMVELTDDPNLNILYLKGHRDEIIEFEQALGVKRVDAEE